jgi:hypothetical protein
MNILPPSSGWKIKLDSKPAWSNPFRDGFLLSLLFNLEGAGNLFLFYSENGGSRFFRNVGKISPDYTVSHPRRQ